MRKTKMYTLLFSVFIFCLMCSTSYAYQYPSIKIAGVEIVNGNSPTYWKCTEDYSTITDTGATITDYNLMYDGNNTLYFCGIELKNCIGDSVIEINSLNDIDIVVIGSNSVVANGAQKGISILNFLCSCRFCGDGILDITTESGIGIYSYSGGTWQANNNIDVIDIKDATVNVTTQKGTAVSVNGITVRGNGKLVGRGAYTAIHSVNSGIYVTDNGYLEGIATVSEIEELFFSDRIAGIYVNDSNGNDIIADKNGIIRGEGTVSGGIRTWHGGVIVKDNAKIVGKSRDGIAINTFGNTYRVEGDGVLHAFSERNYGLSSVNSYLISGGEVLICGGKSAVDIITNRNTLRTTSTYEYKAKTSTQYSGSNPHTSINELKYTVDSKYILIEPYMPTPMPDSLQNIPQTGDNSHIALWLALLTLAGTAILTLKRKTA